MDRLLGKNIDELQAIATEAGLPRFVGKQIAQWLYEKRATSFEQMTNLSLKARHWLSENYAIGRSEPVADIKSVDGTHKFLFKVGTSYVESVLIPDEDRATVCVSTQAGCRMRCGFCMTGTLGFQQHLTAADILNQIFAIDEMIDNGLTNIVYMGEGEPMDNIDEVLRSLEVMTEKWGCAWSPKRITVSSVGIIPNMQRFLNETECHLAISLHNPFPIERAEIMPAEKVFSIDKVIKELKRYDFSHQRRLSFEYICWGGVNDTIIYANQLIKLLKGLDCRINLIRYHAGAESRSNSSLHFTESNEQQMVWLRDYLTEHGIQTTIRRSRGEDILAACGMLVNSLQNKERQ